MKSEKTGQLNRLILDEDKDELWRMLADEGLELTDDGLAIVAHFLIRVSDDGYKLGWESGWKQGWTAGYRDAAAFTSAPSSRRQSIEH